VGILKSFVTVCPTETFPKSQLVGETVIFMAEEAPIPLNGIINGLG
jgi:hypothetical protein